MTSTNLALKEWAVITRALDRGDQLIVIRKGGIREQKKRFVLEEGQFLLYPTYEHQRQDLLKPEYQQELEESLVGHEDNGTVTISNLARVEEMLEITEPEKVDALSPFYICTNEYAHYRLNWRPRKPLSVLLLRVLRLPEPKTLPVLPRYGGCVSWVELEEALDASNAVPVLDDSQFRARIEEIHKAITE